MKFVGCKSAKPLALCVQGANQFSHALMTKSRKTAVKGGPAAPQPQTVLEITDMDKTLLKKSLLWDDTTKAYVGALEDAALDAFLAKSADEQKKEAHEAKAAADKAAADAAALATGKTARELDLEKRLNDQDVVIKGLQDKDVERSLRLRAKTEFAGYPGGEDAAYESLKAVQGQSDAVRKTVEEAMTDRIKAAATLTRTAGLRNAETGKTTPATEKVNAEAKARAEKKNISVPSAMYEMSQEKSWAEAMSEAEREQREPA